MRGQRFSTPKEAVDAFRMHVWIYLNQSGKSVIDLNGEYFEKQ